jgi:hypothetical protein
VESRPWCSRKSGWLNCEPDSNPGRQKG